MKLFLGLLTVMLLAGSAVSVCAQNPTHGLQLSADTVPAADWPVFRRDSGLTGFSPLSGGLENQPAVRWSFNLGGSPNPVEQAQLADVNGDGREELLRVLSDRLICQTVEGDVLWETQRFAHPQIIQVRDFAGDGTRGILVAASNGVAHDRHMVSGVSGKSAFLYTCANVFGRYERVGEILPDVPGEQLCAWWSGDSDTRFGADSARSVGHLWSFENGCDSPTVRFRVEEEGTIYAPLHLFADMNGDGTTDLVMISHEAMWVYDLQTGQRITHSVWGPQIRTYWAATGAAGRGRASLAADDQPDDSGGPGGDSGRCDGHQPLETRCRGSGGSVSVKSPNYASGAGSIRGSGCGRGH